MKKFILLAFLSCQIAFAGPAPGAPTIPSLSVGGRVFTDTSNLLTLVCTINTNSTCTFRKAGSNAGYQVTSGKTLTISALKIWSNASAAAFVQGDICQSDADVGFGSLTALTNPLCLFGGAGGNSIGFIANNGSSPNAQEYSFIYQVASLKYLSMESAAGMMAIAYGYEQ